MRRFLASYAAGILVIVGGWFGWVSADRVEESVDASVELVAPTEEEPSRGEERSAPSTMLRDPRQRLSVAGTEPSPPCDRPRPTGAGGMNRLMNRLDETPTLEGGDHGGSVALADGRRLFVYGDTIRDPVTVSPFMVRNSVLVVDAGCLTPMEGPEGEAAIPDDSDNTGYWPMSLRALEVTGGTKVQVITNRVREAAGGSFQTLGTSLATIEVPTNRTPRLTEQVPLTPDSSDPRVPTWGAAMWDHESTTYVFGTASNETKTTAGWSLHLARSAPRALADTDGWEYWDGSRWVAGAPAAAQTEAAQLIPADRGVSHVLSVFERDGAWYAVSKEGDFHGDALAVWKAPEVTGPWSKHRVRDLPNPPGLHRYTPLAHPDFATQDGRLLVSWSESPTNRGLYHTNPEQYRPRFDEITLP